MDETYTVFGVTDTEFLSGTSGDTRDYIIAAVQSMYSLSRRGALIAKELIYRAMMEVIIYDAVLDGGRVPGLEQYITLIYVNPFAKHACLEAGLVLQELGEVTMEQIAPNSAVLVKLPIYFTQ